MCSSDLCSNNTPLSLPSRYANEDEAIGELFRMLNAYNNNPLIGSLPYKLIPRQGRDEYNSNSFISGIGAAGGFSMPVFTGARTPGYNNPVPNYRFW